MQRLYLQFYVTILIVLAVFVGAAVLLWRVADDDNRTPQYLDVAAELTGALLPDATAPRADQQRAIEGLQRKLRFDIALYELFKQGKVTLEEAISNADSRTNLEAKINFG